MKRTLTLSIALAAALAILTPAAPAEMITNGSFEDGSGGTMTGWSTNDYAHASDGSQNDTAEVGSYSLRMGRIQSNSTTPAVYQNFDIGTDTSFKVSGYAKVDHASGVAAIRIREQGLGTVKYYDGTSWEDVTISQAGSYYASDLWALGSARTVGIGQNSDWEYFEITIPKYSSVTAYTIDLGAPGVTGGSQIHFDGISIVPEPATMGLLAFGGLGMLLRRKRK
jgi:hypothetical protein